jgi:hypothetical protein
VVCHAYRRVPRPAHGVQGTFIGGGGLAVRIDRDMPFFPKTYNEDWLFMYPYLREGSVAHMGSLGQQPYEPFGRPYVARLQEFGDLLGEGLFRLVHGEREGRASWDADHFATDPSYWAAEIDRRHQLIAYVRDSATAPARELADIHSCLAAAEAALSRLYGQDLAAYLSAWGDDRRRWTAHLDGLEPVSSFRGTRSRMDAALERVGLPPARVLMPTTAPRPITGTRRPGMVALPARDVRSVTSEEVLLAG